MMTRRDWWWWTKAMPLAKLTDRQAHWLFWPSVVYYVVALFAPEPVGGAMMTGFTYWLIGVALVLMWPISLASVPLLWWLW